MKKRYNEPQIELIKYSIKDSLLTSPGGINYEDDELPFVPANTTPITGNTP